MNPASRLIDAVKAAVRTGIDTRDVVAVVGKLFARTKPRGLPDDFVAFDHEPGAIGVDDHPFAPEERDRTVGGVADGDEVDECMRFVCRQTRSAVVVVEFVEPGR